MVPNPLTQTKSLSEHRSCHVKLSQLAIESGIVFQSRGIILRVFAIMLKNLQCMLKSDLRVGQISCSLAGNCENDVPFAQFVATQLAGIDGGFRNFGSIVETSAVLLDQGVSERRGWIGLSQHRHVQQPQSKQSPTQMSHTNTLTMNWCFSH